MDVDHASGDGLRASPGSQALADLPVGARAIVARVGGERSVSRRLLEMGLTPGTRVTVVRVGPLGDPIQFRVRGYALSIRAADAANIDVTGVRQTAVSLESLRYSTGPSS